MDLSMVIFIINYFLTTIWEHKYLKKLHVYHKIINFPLIYYYSKITCALSILNFFRKKKVF